MLLEKFILCLVLSLLASLGSVSMAKNGDVIGNIYATNIKTYINGYPISSYNIGGKTCICVEDLDQYRYDVLWLNLADYGYNI